MKKLLVIGTGGTIAAVQSKDGLKPAHGTEELVSFFPEALLTADVECRTLFNLDSTNMQPRHWSEMAKEIGKQYDKYDGFVVMHGTDTMQFTAAALSFMLQNLGKPVVLTGSVKAMGDGNDARQNFVDSIIVAASGVPEVCVVFHGRIIRGCRARKITNEATRITNENLDVYSSINCHLLGELKERKIIFGKDCGIKHVEGRLKVLLNVDASGVFAVKIHPGIRPEIFDRPAGVRCVLVEAYGPGNIPFSLLEKIEALTGKGIPVFITSQNPFGEADMTLYEVGRKALKAGCIPCRDMTSEAALVKLMWIMGNFGSDGKTVKKLMLKDFVGEIRD